MKRKSQEMDRIREDLLRNRPRAVETVRGWIAGMADPRRYLPAGPPERVELATPIPEGSWPETAEEFGQMHRLADITVPQVATAWERLHHRREIGT